MDEKVRCTLCLAGDAGVGKTSFVRRVIYKDWSQNQIPTIGIEYNLHKIGFEPLDAPDGEVVQTEQMEFAIWDTAGQERFAAIITSYFRKKDFVIIVYAIDDRESFKRVDHHIERVKMHASSHTSFILLGTKADKKRKVSYSSGRTKSLQHGCCFFAETSSKEDSSDYQTPLEVMKRIAQIKWKRKLAHDERMKEDLQAAKDGYATASYPEGRLSLTLEEPPTSKKTCSC